MKIEFTCPICWKEVSVETKEMVVEGEDDDMEITPIEFECPGCLKRFNVNGY